MFDARELDNIWRILVEDLFRPRGYDRFHEVVDQLRSGKPIQHITNVQYFYGNKFYVDEHVLIPRPETEELVDLILSDFDNARYTVLDFGTGSGCIAISLKLKRSNWQVSGIDISKDALAVASKNGNTLQADVSFVAGDMLDDVHYPADADIVVCNPPYVLYADRSVMDDSVVLHEPDLALFVEDNDPLVFYRTIAGFANKRLKKGGFLFFETNEFNAPKVLSMLQNNGFTEVLLKQDLEGKDRMIRASK